MARGRAPEEPYNSPHACRRRALSEPGQRSAAMENKDQPVNGLEQEPPVGTDEHSFAALCKKRLRERGPAVDTKSGRRGGNQEDGRNRGADAGAPLTSGDKRHGKQDPELRLVGETSDEDAGQHWPPLEEQQRCAEQRRRQKPILSDEKIPC